VTDFPTVRSRNATSCPESDSYTGQSVDFPAQDLLSESLRTGSRASSKPVAFMPPRRGHRRVCRQRQTLKSSLATISRSFPAATGLRCTRLRGMTSLLARYRDACTGLS